MPTDIFQQYVNPVTRATYQVLSHDEGSCWVRWTLRPAGYLGHQYAWLHQDVTYHVDKGRLHIRSGEHDHSIGVGEQLSIACGQPLAAYNPGREEVTCRLEIRPGLDSDKFWQCFMGLMADGKLEKGGGVSIARMGYFQHRLKLQTQARLAYMPQPLFKTVLAFCGLIGGVRGWRRDLERYTGI